VKMSMYGPVCAFAAGYHHDGCTHITDRMLGGGIGGAVGVAIANPFDVVKYVTPWQDVPVPMAVPHHKRCAVLQSSHAS